MRFSRCTTVAAAALLAAGGAVAVAPVAIAAQTAAAAPSAAVSSTGTPVDTLPFRGSGDVTGVGTGSPGTAAWNARVAAACNGGAPISGTQWYRLPPVAGRTVYARTDAPYVNGRNWANNPTGSAFVDARTGAVVGAHSGAYAYTVGQRRGLRLVEVVPGGPAASAGLFIGDVVIAAGGRQVKGVQDIQRLMLGSSIGTRLPITALRRGALVDVIAVPAPLE
jgi:membrane-associated protease RseP (regulator of RpoE activity)